MKRSALSQAAMKKSLSLMLVFVMAMNIFAYPVLASNDVAYIFKNKNAVDDNIVDVFEDLGLDVDLIDEKNIPDLSNYRLVYLGDERYRNQEDIMIWKYPSIVSNYYFGDEWGLTDRDGVSKLGSSFPLSVKKGNQVIQVYTQAMNRGLAIPYYFLSKENKVSGLTKVASPFTNNGDIRGDVISYGGPGLELDNGEITENNICFFGIIESEYWTEDAVELFEECVDYVGVTCENNADCSDEELGDPYCIGTQVYQNINEGTCQDGGSVQSSCVGTPAQVLLEVCSNSCQAGACVCLDKDNDGFDECVFGTDGDDGNNLDCNDNNANVNPGHGEICGDYLDNNCDGQVDEHCPVDVDNDGYDNSSPGQFGDDGLPLDCNDNNLLINPGADEICDFLDNDCNGEIDEGCSVDNDDDGYDNTEPGSPGDDGRPVDCNDNDDDVHPNAFEICDGKDNDCDANIDESDGDCGFGEVCSFGSCTAVTCDSNSDCGVDGFFDGRFCDGQTNDDVFQNYVTWTCENPGTVSSSCTQEVDARLVTDCSDTCSEGSCVSIGCNTDSDCDDSDFHTEDICENAGTVNSFCIHEPIECISNSDCDDNDDFTVDSCEGAGGVDSQCVYEDIVCIDDIDCGIDGFVNGLSCTGDDVVQDYRSFTCVNGGTISASCSQMVEPRVVSQCADTCSEGSCVTVTCNGDSDCDDGNPASTDICLNPGSVDSQCTHEDVLCLNDGECGTNRYTGELFCEGQKIFRNFASFSCNAPGTQASFCSNSIDPQEVFTCTYACNEGSCIRCNTQTDCDDGDDGTVDVCRFGGSIDSYCSHDVVSCFDDDECGADSFVGAPYCVNGDVYQNFRDLSCTNAGTSGSFCDADVEGELVEVCEFGCSAGSCEDERECSNVDSNGNAIDDDDDDLANELDPGCWDDVNDPSTYNPELDDEGRADAACNDDFDCGFDIVLFPPVCEDSHVVGRALVPVCFNPGLGSAQCGEVEEVETLDVCTGDEICLVDRCVLDCIDLDNDGFDTCPVGEPDDDGQPLDCVDNNGLINPGATEICDGIDNDCNGQIDEGCPLDLDGDGFDNANPGDFGDDGKPVDCRDDVFEINPDALEVCDSIDNNCDGLVDENGDDSCGVGGVCSLGSCSLTECADTVDNADNDGLADAEDPGCWDDQGVRASYNPNLNDEGAGSIECVDSGDCVVGQGGESYCSGNNVVFDQPIPVCLNPNTGLSSCSSDSVQVLVQECDPSQVCLVGSCTIDCVDVDLDGFDTCDVGEPDDDGLPLDCMDLNNLVNPGVAEMCGDGLDNDCDGGIDNGCSVDLDGDGFDNANPGDFGDDGKPVDCRDDVFEINPDALEVCDGIDNNCDAQIDEGGNSLCSSGQICKSGQCVNVVCDQNSDCGADGFVGGRFCSGTNSISQNYRTFTCINPGTAFSSCSSVDETRSIGSCGSNQECDAGICEQVGDWYPAWAQDCNSFCSSRGLINIGGDQGHRCTSGENVIEAARQALGTGIYRSGCWPESCSSPSQVHDFVQNVPAGAFCYHTGVRNDGGPNFSSQKRDNDGTDITAACFCG